MTCPWLTSFSAFMISGGHPEIMKALNEVNQGHVIAYGNDGVGIIAKNEFGEHFGFQFGVYFVFNGTAANVLALRFIADPWSAIICARESHLCNHECGAPERIGGWKLLPVPTQDGKITVEEIKKHLFDREDVHASQANVLSIAQPTELGTVYTIEELKKIRTFCDENRIKIHMDGARFINAAEHLGVELKELSIFADVLSFGGAKKGLLFGEAVLVTRYFRGAHFLQKQTLQLASKERFISAQFERLLRDDLWKEIAPHENTCARSIAERLKPYELITVLEPVEANMVFIKVPKEWIRGRVFEEFNLSPLPGTDNVLRVVTSWDTTEDDIDALIFLCDRKSRMKTMFEDLSIINRM